MLSSVTCYGIESARPIPSAHVSCIMHHDRRFVGRGGRIENIKSSRNIPRPLNILNSYPYVNILQNMYIHVHTHLSDVAPRAGPRTL